VSNRLGAIQGEAKSLVSGQWGDRLSFINAVLLERLGMKQWMSKEESNFLRIVPPLTPDAYFGFKVHVHFNLGVGKDAFLCPRMMKKERCPACERQDELKKAGADEDVVKSLSCWPPRYLFFVIDKKNKETEAEGVQLYNAPNSINAEIIGLSKNKRTGELIDISDPEHGKLLVFDRKGKTSTNTRYSAFELQDDGPLDPALMEVPDFEELLIMPDLALMRHALGQTTEPAATDKPESERVPADQTRTRTRETTATPETVKAPDAEKKVDPPAAPKTETAQAPAAGRPSIDEIRAKAKARLAAAQAPKV